MLHLTDEQKQMFANRIQTSASKSKIRTRTKIERFVPYISNDCLFEESIIGIANAKQVSFAMDRPTESLVNSALYAAYVSESGQGYISSAKYNLSPGKQRWTTRKCLSGLKKLEVVFNYIRENDYLGQPLFCTNADPIVFSLSSDGVLTENRSIVIKSTGLEFRKKAQVTTGCDDFSSVAIKDGDFGDTSSGILIFLIEGGKLYFMMRSFDGSYTQKREVPGTSGQRWIYAKATYSDAHKVYLQLQSEYERANGEKIGRMYSAVTKPITTKVVENIELEKGPVNAPEAVDLGFNSTLGIFDMTDYSVGANPIDDEFAETITVKNLCAEQFVVSPHRINGGVDDVFGIYGSFEQQHEDFLFNATISDGPYSSGAHLWPKRMFSACAMDYSNGFVHMVGCYDGKLYYHRYIRSLDVSDVVSEWSIDDRDGNPIKQIDYTILNVNRLDSSNDYSIFVPGSVITSHLVAGNSDPIFLGKIFIDEVETTYGEDTISVSGRNAVGFLMKDSVFNLGSTESHKIHYAPWVRSYVRGSVYGVESILLCDKDRRYPTGTTGQKTVSISGVVSALDCINAANEAYYVYPTEHDRGESFGIWSGPNGELIVGNRRLAYAAGYLDSDYIDLDERDVFTKSVTKNADAVYSHILNTSINTVIADKYFISSFPGWYVPEEKAYVITYDENTTAEQKRYFENVMPKKLHQIGKTYSYVVSINPAITPGDVVRIGTDGDYKILGVVTEVSHSFNATDGYRTELHISSGGDISIDEGFLNAGTVDFWGITRKQTITDVVKQIKSGKDNTLILP